jgi:hypothetical protein
MVILWLIWSSESSNVKIRGWMITGRTNKEQFIYSKMFIPSESKERGSHPVTHESRVT